VRGPWPSASYCITSSSHAAGSDADGRERYRQALGEQFDAEKARGAIVEAAGGALLRSALLAWQGAEMGLTVSDAEVREYLRGAGLVDASGRLVRDSVTNYAEREFGSVRRFQERLRSDLLAENTSRLIRDGAAISDAEVRDALRYQLEEVKIAAVKLDGGSPPENLEVPEEAAKALLEKDPERVRESHEARRGQFDRPEQATNWPRSGSSGPRLGTYGTVRRQPFTTGSHA